MPSSYNEIIGQLKQRKFAPVYFLWGEEPYYIDLVSDYIEENVLQESERGFNQTIMYGKDVDVPTILSNAKRFPMMSEKQVVIVKEAQEITNFTKEENAKMMESYLLQPLPSTILVFNYKYKKLDMRTKFGKLLDKHAVVLESKRIYDDKIPGWIHQYVKEKGTTIDEKAAQLLAEYIGNNLERQAHEIDKILINFKEPVKITAALVQKFVGISKDYNVFELIKALAFRNMTQAYKIGKYFEANPKSNPLILVISNIFNFYNKLLLIHQETNKSEANIASVIGVNKFFVSDYLTAARNYPLPKTIQNIGYIKEADLRSKGINAGNMNEGQILKELLYKLMN